MARTTVVNIRSYKGKDAVYCGRPSLFGNPYVIGKDGTREEVILAFSIYFEQRMNRDKEFREAIDNLKGRILGCFCRPLACHCDVIAEYLNIDGRWINVSFIADLDNAITRA